MPVGGDISPKRADEDWFAYHERTKNYTPEQREAARVASQAAEEARLAAAAEEGKTSSGSRRGETSSGSRRSKASSDSRRRSKASSGSRRSKASSDSRRSKASSGSRRGRRGNTTNNATGSTGKHDANSRSNFILIRSAMVWAT